MKNDLSFYDCVEVLWLNSNFPLLRSFLVSADLWLELCLVHSQTFLIFWNSSVIYNNVMVLDGNSEIGVHVGRNPSYLICLRHVIS